MHTLGFRAACLLSVLIGIISGTVAADNVPPLWNGPIRAEHIRPHVEFLASPELAGRSGPNAIVAADDVRKHLEQLRLKPLFPNNSATQLIPGVAAADKPKNESPNGGDSEEKSAQQPASVVGRNVGLWLEGTDPTLRKDFIVLGAHFDHLGVRNGKILRGADDNATGTAMLLEAARQLAESKSQPRRSVAFVGFDMEEQLLYGSRWFVAHPPFELSRVKLFLTADMIGRSLGDLPLQSVFVLGSEHAPQLKVMLDKVGAPQGLEVARLGVDLIGVRSDYGPFWNEKIPFLFFSTGEHPDYHTPRDVPEKVDFLKAARISSLILKVVEAAANADIAPEWTDNVPPSLDEVSALHRITELLLAAEGQRKYTDLQKLLITQTQAKSRQLLDRGTLTAADRQWLIRTTQLLLLSVF